MTHEAKAGDEAEHGPEHDHTLPDAAGIPVYDGPEDSFAPELTEDLED